ncbi:MAG: hypothetical protein ACYCQJ_03220 [Nitrososphaerales archaeon]
MNRRALGGVAMLSFILLMSLFAIYSSAPNTGSASGVAVYDATGCASTATVASTVSGGTTYYLFQQTQKVFGGATVTGESGQKAFTATFAYATTSSNSVVNQYVIQAGTSTTICDQGGLFAPGTYSFVVSSSGSVIGNTVNFIVEATTPVFPSGVLFLFLLLPLMFFVARKKLIKK